MKNLVKFFAVALLGIAAAACSEKELAQEPVSEEGGIKPVYENLGTVSFTAQFENKGTKGYDAQGKVKWEVGDYIIVAPQRRVIGGVTETDVAWYPTNDTKVVLTSEMISADGKTATFSIDGLPTDVPGYYAMSSPTLHGSNAYVDGGNCWEKDYCWINNVHTGGYVGLNTFTEYGALCKPHLSYASCTVSDTKLTFKNVGTILKWDTRANNIQHVDFVDNSGANVHILAYSSAVNGNPGMSDSYAPATLKCYTSATNSGSALGGPYYIFLCPQTFSQGFSLYFYSGWSGYQDGATPVGKIVVDGEFVAKAGDFWDLGYIEDHFHYDTYKEAYDAGQTIKIGDLEVNKANYPSSKLITSIADTYEGNGTAYSQWGVIFVNPDVDGVVLKGSGEKCIVIGNDPTKRSSIQFSEQISLGTNANVAFKNLNMSWASAYTGTWFASAPTINNFAFDNCRIDFYTRLVELGAAGTINNFSIMNCDFVIRNDATDGNNIHPGIICRAEADYTGSKLIFRNNLVTTSSTTVKKIGLISMWSSSPGITFNTIDISQNTFHNIGSAGEFLNINNIGTSVTMTKNLLWKGANFNWIKLYGLADGASAAFTYSGVTDNKLEGWILRANNGDAIVATGTAGHYQQKDENYPFSAGDLATVISTRDYTPIATLSGYGVTNPKRLQ
ncbi:MAG: hypothetical protein IJQ93_12655 [Bacteroidales bacterium]|nr:hypothetical protein [Bacteroidales bacterium]